MQPVDQPAEPIPSLRPNSVANALVAALQRDDPVSPRVALATIRSLRRAENGHVARVTATVEEVRHVLEHFADGDPRRAHIARLLGDLAPFEIRATLKLCGVDETPILPAPAASRHSVETPPPLPRPLAHQPSRVRHARLIR